MNIYVDKTPENCNGCIFKLNASRYWDVEDYCFLNKLNISDINIDEDCMLEELKTE